MTSPTLARKDDDDRRFYVFGDPLESFWSVTTIIGGGVPKYLHAHYAKLAAELALEAIAERGPYSRGGAIIRRLAARGRANVVERQARGELKSIKLAKLTELDLALRWVKGAAERHRDAAAEKGTAVHGQAEQLVLTYAREAVRLTLEGIEVPPWPDEIAGWQPGFVAWIRRYHPEFLAAEATVFNRAQAYAGTLDTIVRLTRRDGSTLVVIVDFKTGSDIYPEVGLQLASYARAEFIGAPDGRTQLPLPTIDAGAVLHLRSDGTYSFRQVRIDRPIFDAFLYAREVFRFKVETGRTVLLDEFERLLDLEAA